MYFCTLCKLNHATLPQQVNEEIDEEFIVCPNCNSSLDLIEVTQPVLAPPQYTPVPPPVKQQKVTKRFMTREEIWEADKRQDAALEAYHRLCDTDRAAAEQAYKNIISKQ